MSEIHIDHVSRWFRNVVAVNDVSMTIGPGVTGLLGPNGAGKSTLIAMMSGFLAPSTGTVTLDGEPLWRNEQVYKKVGLVPEREALYDYLTGRQFVVAMAELHGLADPGAAAQRALVRHRDDRGAGPADLDVLQGHAAAGEDGLRAGARPDGAAARRAVQRHGSAAADPPHGPAPQHGRRRADGAVQLAQQSKARPGRTIALCRRSTSTRACRATGASAPSVRRASSGRSGAAIHRYRAGPMSQTIELPRVQGPGSGLGGHWRVIVRNDDHNTFDHVARTLARYIPGVNVDGGLRLRRPDPPHGSGDRVDREQEPAELYWEQLSDAGLTMAPLEQG